MANTNLNFIAKVKKSIDDEWAAYNFYSRLMERTNDDFFRSLIDHARQDEKRHYNEFQEMHRRLTGQYYMNNEKMVSFPKLKEGVKMAMQDELEAAESYRTMMFEIENDEDFEVLFKAMSDEVEHAIRFSTIYNAIKE